MSQCRSVLGSDTVRESWATEPTFRRKPRDDTHVLIGVGSKCYYVIVLRRVFLDDLHSGLDI